MLDPLPEATQKYFDICNEKLGMVPNVLQAYAFDTDKLNAFTALYNDVMLAASGLSKLEREMIAVTVSSINFLGTEFTLADCGGQQTHLDEYLSKYPEDVFSNVAMLIYVFDIEYLEDKDYQQSYIDILSRLLDFSPGAKIFVLIHKIDKIKASDLPPKRRLCTQIVQRLTVQNSIEKIFFTSIWDDTLYNAWSQIVQSMIPVLREISQSITEFGQTNHCDEIVLVEKDTFLIVSNFERVPTREDVSYGRYERIAGIFKMLKINCREEELERISVKNKGFQAVLQKYTEITYILINQRNQRVIINSVLRCPLWPVSDLGWAHADFIAGLV